MMTNWILKKSNRKTKNQIVKNIWALMLKIIKFCKKILKNSKNNKKNCLKIKKFLKKKISVKKIKNLRFKIQKILFKIKIFLIIIWNFFKKDFKFRLTEVCECIFSFIKSKLYIKI